LYLFFCFDGRPPSRCCGQAAACPQWPVKTRDAKATALQGEPGFLVFCVRNSNRCLSGLTGQLAGASMSPNTTSILHVGVDVAKQELQVSWPIAPFNVGAGIVADSNPDAEYAETLAKAAGFLAALNQDGRRLVAPAATV